MTGWNLPPGCNVSDLPGNDLKAQLWEEFDAWAMKELACLSLREAYWAVRMGIAAVKAQRADLEVLVKDICDDSFEMGKEAAEQEKQ